MVDMAHFAGPGRGRAAPLPGAVRGRGHHHDPQDPRRPARRRDPVQAGVRQEDQLRGLPRPAGRPAGARHRRQGGGLQDRGDRRSSRSARQRTLDGASILAERLLQPDVGRGRRLGALRRHRRAPRPGRPARQRAGRPAGRGPAPRGRHHGQPQRRPERPAPADGHLRAAHRHARRWPPAASRHGGLPRGRRHHRRGAACRPSTRTRRRPAPRASRRWPRSTRSTPALGT